MIVCLESHLCRLFCWCDFYFFFILLIWNGIQFYYLFFAIALQIVIVQVWNIILTYYDLLQKLFCLFKFNKLVLLFVNLNLILLYDSFHLLIRLYIHFCMEYLFLIGRKGEIFIQRTFCMHMMFQRWLWSKHLWNFSWLTVQYHNLWWLHYTHLILILNKVT